MERLQKIRSDFAIHPKECDCVVCWLLRQLALVIDEAAAANDAAEGYARQLDRNRKRMNQAKKLLTTALDGR
jgi:hypothetical protein